MPVKITRSQRRLKALTFAEQAKPKFLRFVNKFIKQAMIESIERGVSPVNQGGKSPKQDGGRLRFQKYSESYTDQIKKKQTGESGKRQRPVNLKLSGKLLRSIKSKVFRDYVRVWFTDGKAKYHDKLGAGKSKVIRRMAPNPKNGERFNTGITRRIKQAYLAAFKSIK